MSNVQVRGIVCDKTREAVDEILLLGYATNLRTREISSLAEAIIKHWYRGSVI